MGVTEKDSLVEENQEKLEKALNRWADSLKINPYHAKFKAHMPMMGFPFFTYMIKTLSGWSLFSSKVCEVIISMHSENIEAQVRSRREYLERIKKSFPLLERILGDTINRKVIVRS